MIPFVKISELNKILTLKFLTVKFELKCLNLIQFNLISPELQSTIRIIYLHKNNIKYPPCKKM